MQGEGSDGRNASFVTGPIPRPAFGDVERRTTGPIPVSAAPGGRASDSAVRATGGLFAVDEAGILRAFDGRMERLTGWVAADVVGRGKDLDAFGGGASFPLYFGRLPRVLAPTPTNLVLSRRDGAQLLVDALLSPQGGGAQVEVQRIRARFLPPLTGDPADDRDPLTRLPREASFLARIDRGLELSSREGRSLSVLVVDVDQLASINEQYGREVGDEALRNVAGVLSATVRQTDAVARLGDDEFGVLLMGAGRGDSRQVGGRIRTAVESFGFQDAPGITDVEVTVNVGAACVPADAENAPELLRRARGALGELHRLGHDRAWCYVRRPRAPLKSPVFFDGPAGALLGMARNISSSGLFVETTSPVSVGSRIGLRLRLPGSQAPLRVVARVVRRVGAAATTAHEPHGVGLEFERFGDGDRRRLSAFLLQTLPEAV